MNRCLDAATLSLLLLTAGAAAEEESAAERELEQVRRLEQAFAKAVVDHDSQRFHSLVADDGIFLGDKIDRGRAAFVTTWSSLFDPRREVSLEWQPLEVEMAGSADLAYGIGRVLMRWPLGRTGEFRERPGHYLQIWRKNSQGAWKVALSGTLAAHPEGLYGFGRQRLRGLAEVWPPLAALGVRTELEWRPETVVEAESGELAYTFGSYRVTTGEGDARQEGEGGYLTLWKRDGKGYWVVAAEALSPPL